MKTHKQELSKKCLTCKLEFISNYEICENCGSLEVTYKI